MDETLYAAVLETRGYIVGSSNAPSGLHVYTAGAGWQHRGWTNVRCFGIARHEARSMLFLAAGNGVFRSLDDGATWRVMTGWEITEVLDLALDPFDADTLWIATVHGLWRSPDLGETFLPVHPRTTQLFCQTLAADRATAGRWFVGTETGLLCTETSGAQWHAPGPHDAAIRAICQSPSDPSVWLAGTEDRGLLHSTDGGRSWATHRPAGCDTFYAVAIHPAHPEILIAGGFDAGVCVSLDGGATWRRTGDDMPVQHVHALAISPSGRFVAGTVHGGIYASVDAGASWTFAGLPEATLYDLVYA
ncbi:MAG: hypothetical protein R2834_01670 [Rhodothermales bacterium]